jgi:hypothetical protein
MSDQIIALLITVSLFILMCVWVPLLNNIAIHYMQMDFNEETR